MRKTRQSADSTIESKTKILKRLARRVNLHSIEDTAEAIRNYPCGNGRKLAEEQRKQMEEEIKKVKPPPPTIT